MNIIVSFHNAGIAIRLDQAGISVGHVNMAHFRYLLHALRTSTVTLEIEMQEDNSKFSDGMGDAEEPDIPIWLRILDEEAAKLLGDDEQWSDK
jgi:hypothetical protein